MDYIFIQRKGDMEAIINYKESLGKLTLDELVNKYNGQAKLGFTGVHQQARLVVAMHQEFLGRINESPIKIEENLLISFKGAIALIDNKIVYLNGQDNVKYKQF